MRIQSLSHSVYQHQYHIVWGTKYLRKWIKEYAKKELLACLFETVKKHPEIWIAEVNTDEDHIHIQIEIPPDISVAAVVQMLKSQSSKQIQKKFKYVREMYLDGSIWSIGYFSSTIGLNESQVKKYIQHQGRQEAQQTMKFKQGRLEFS